MKAASRLLALSAAFLMTVSTPSSGAVDDSLAGGVEVTFALRPGYGLLGSGRDYGFYQLGLGSSTSATTHQTIDNASAWRSVAFGNHYALALKADSTMWGWGRGATYAFGDGTTNNRSAPTQVGSSKWIKVVAGLYVANSFGIRHDSTLWVWGRNQGGGLGTGDGNAKTTPVQLTSHKWLDVSNINNHGLAIRSDSTLWGWGWSSQNNLTSAVSAGLNTTPAQLDASGKWISVFAGYDYSFGIKADSTLWSWGYNQYGLTGLGTTSGNQATPVQVGSHKWLKVKGCQQVVMALRADSTLWAWGTSGYSGSNGYGLLGQGASVTDRSTPGQIGSSKWRNFALGSGEAIAIDASGGYWGWGKNAYGGIGDGTTTARLEPVGITPGQSIQTITFAALPAKTFLDADFSPGASASSGLTVSYASSNPAVATIVSGQIHLVGAGTATITASQAGNAGYAAAADVARTLTVGNPAHPHEDRKITGGNGFTLAIRDGVGLYGTGRNSNYRLGLGDTVSRNRYHLIAPGNWRHVDGGDSYALALKEDSTLWGWGYHYTGLGDGNTQHSIPAQIGSSRWITVSAGLYTGTNLGIRSDSTLWAWGENYYGLYGNGTTTTQSAPTQVGSDKWLAVSQAQIHALALKADHTLWAWGYANSGRRGDGATSGNITTPVQIGTDRWLTVAAGYETSYALRTDSTLWAWGPNIAGGTGQGTMSGNTTTPTQVTGGGKWIWLGDVNWGGAVAMKADSTLWTWGSNAETLVAAAPNRATPGQVGSAKWRQVTLGYTGGLGLDSAGDFYGWGYNSTGHVGDSSNTTRTAPTLSKFNRSQTLTFPALAAKTLGDADFAPGASANTGLAVTYSSSDTTVATLVSGQIHIVGAGTSLITASQAGNAYFDPADSSRTLTVSKLSQSLTFNALSSKTYGDAPFVLSATATSGLAATYSSSDTSVARISGDTVVGVGAGSTQITASQAGNASYSAAADVARSLTIVKATQTLSFPALAAKTPLDADFAPGATSSAGLAVSYASSDTLVASIISGQIHIVGVGTATITASQPGNGNYLAAADSSQVLTVGHASQSITFNALSNKTYGDADFSLAATASSGLPVSYASSDTSVARISGSTVTVVGAGSADITASQAGNATYSAASNVVRSLTVDKAAQTIAFPALAAKTLLDADFAPGATSSAGLAVSYASSNAAVATVVSGQIHIVGAGTATITATQPGNGNYLAAADSSVVLTVGLASQSITFNALSTRTYGDAGFTLGATASSGLTVTYASSDTSVARISGSTVTVVGAGSTHITASQAGNSIYSAAAVVTRNLTVNQAIQSISFPAISSKTRLDADFAPGATASSGLPVTYASSNTSVAAIVSGQIHILGTGTTTITASQSGNGNYLAAADSSQVLSIGLASQSITFNALSTRTYGGAGFTLGATASSGLTITYASSDTTVARISGSTVTLVGAGSANITASQAGDATYSAATDVTRTLTVDKAPQTISFPSLAGKTPVDPDFSPGAASSSGLPVSYASSNAAVATIVSGQIHIVGAGSTTITASQAGNINYLAAADSSVNLIVGQAAQSITFNALSTKTFGDAGFSLDATASSGLTVTYASSDTSVAKVSGSTVTVVGAGSTHITASQAGNSTYSAAADMTRTLTVNQAIQSISFPAFSSKTRLDADFAPGATASSGLPVTYASSNTTVATIVSGQIHILETGTTTITASQPGNGNYLAAADSSQVLNVGFASQSITFNTLSAKTFGDASFSLDATASSGLTVTYASSDTTVARISGSTVTVVGAGSAGITASQAGNAAYSAAPNVIRTLTVDKAAQSLAFPTLAARTPLDADFAPGATSSSGLPVSYVSSNTAVATIVSGQIHIVGTGTATLTASQPGNGNYLAAPDSSQVLTVGLAPQSITFDAISTKAYGDADFSLGATASSGLAVTYTCSDTTVARISGASVTLVGAGSVAITASQDGNGSFAAASGVTRTLTVNKAPQTLTFPALAAKTPLDADFAPGATASSGLPVSYASSNPAVATLVSGQIHIVGTGTAAITASQAGNANYAAAADLARTLSVVSASQTLAFAAPPPRTFGDTAFALSASASSGLPVTFTSSDTTVARISGSTVTLVNAGSATLSASQAGNGTYSPASDVMHVLTVNKAPQTLVFPALSTKAMGDAHFAPGASASSGLAVSYSSSKPDVAGIIDGQVHIVGPGTTDITASQAGSANFLAADHAVQTLTVETAGQTIVFEALPTKTYGDSAFLLVASASSGLAVSFASSDTLVARIAGSTVTLVGAGTADITASQAGNTATAAAIPVTRTLTIAKAAQSLAFSLGGDSLKTEGDAAFRLAAASSAGLAVRYLSSDTAVARVIGDSVRIGRAGVAELSAHQDGDGRYLAAASTARTLRVRTAVPASLALADLNPAGTLDADTSILLTWATRIKAAGYRLQATRSPAAAVFLDTLLVDTSFTLSGLAFGSALDWRAAPFNATGQADFSPAASIKVRPAPPLPVDVARIPIQAKEGMGTTVELTWPPVESSTAYRVQASLEGDQVPIIDTVITSPSLTLKELSPGGKYVWRVAPMTGVSQAPFTPWLTFAIRDKDDGAVTRGVVTDSGKAAQVSDLVAVAPRDSTVGNVTLTVTEEKKAPAHLPPGFQPLTGNITLSASNGAGTLDDDQLTITLTPPDTSLDGRPVGGEQPLVYTVDSATGELRVVYDLPRDSLGRIVLPLSRGRSFILAVDTVAPVVKDSTPSEPRPAGSNLVIRGAVDDNIRNCRTTLRYRRGGEETFDSVTVTIDAQGRFELPLDLELDSTGFEYALTATDGRNVQGTPSSNVPVEVQALKAGDSLPSMQWRLFALPTLPKEFRWAGLAAELGTYGEDWKLAARTAAGLEEVGGGLEKAEAGIAYWLKSRRRGFTPSIAGGVAAPVNKPFERALPPKTWISFGNPFLFEVAWSKVLEATGPAAASLAGPYTYRDTAWVPPLEIPALVPWEGYYVYNASEDTVRLRIPAFKSRNVQPALAKASFHLQWQVRGADGKDAGNFFGGLAGQATPPGLGKRSGAATFSSWQTPKPASPEASLRAGFVSGEAAGLLLTDFRDIGTQGGLTFTARLSGLQAGRTYANRLEGFESLPPGTAVALADPATGAFLPWTAGSVYEVKPQGGEENRDLFFHAGSPAYVEARGAEFAAAHPFVVELRNFPNPMRGFAMVHFAVPATPLGSQAVRLRVFDMQGRLVGTLAEGPRKTGRHGLRWEARDAKGRALAAGSYRLLLEVGTRRLDRSLILLP